jgi:hypothetical protein
MRAKFEVPQEALQHAVAPFQNKETSRTRNTRKSQYLKGPETSLLLTPDGGGKFSSGAGSEPS